MWRLFLPAYNAAFVGEDLYMHAQSFFGEDFLYVFRPFHETEATGVEIIEQSDVQGLCRLVEAIKVKVKDTLAVGAAVFVDYRKGGRTYGIVSHPKAPADRGDEGGFPGSHGSIESDEAVPCDCREELLRCGIDP